MMKTVYVCQGSYGVILGAFDSMEKARAFFASQRPSVELQFSLISDESARRLSSQNISVLGVYSAVDGKTWLQVGTIVTLDLK